nr:nitrilase-related carbon-nitrogen hydrolase [Jiangella alkaliphila]
MFGGGRPFPGVAERAAEVSSLVAEMAAAAASGTTRGGLDLVVLPELVASPPGPVASLRALSLDDPVFEVYRAVARRHGTYLVVTLDLAEDGVVSNAAVLLDRAGAVGACTARRTPSPPPGRPRSRAG